jgi:hypothetical protein
MMKVPSCVHVLAAANFSTHITAVVPSPVPSNSQTEKVHDALSARVEMHPIAAEAHERLTPQNGKYVSAASSLDLSIDLCRIHYSNNGRIKKA